MSFLFMSLTALLLLFKDEATRAAGEAVLRWLYVLLPSLLPMTVLSLCLVQVASVPESVKKLFIRLGLPGGAVMPFVLGCLGGYPTGARLLKAGVDAGEISKKSAAYALPLCVNPGIAFVLNCFGESGGMVYGMVLLSSMLVGVLFCQAEALPQKSKATASFFSIIETSVKDGVAAMLSVLGATAFFSAMGELLPLPFRVRGLEVTADLAQLSVAFDLPLMAAVLAFGGFSVFMQVAMLSELSPLWCVVGNVIKSVFCYVLVWQAQKRGTAIAVALGVLGIVIAKAVRQGVQRGFPQVHLPVLQRQRRPCSIAQDGLKSHSIKCKCHR